MSEKISKIVTRLIADDDFRKKFNRNINEVEKEYNLTANELERLNKLNIDELILVGDELENQLSKTFIELSVKSKDEYITHSNLVHNSHSSFLGRDVVKVGSSTW